MSCPKPKYSVGQLLLAEEQDPKYVLGVISQVIEGTVPHYKIIWLDGYIEEYAIPEDVLITYVMNYEQLEKQGKS